MKHKFPTSAFLLLALTSAGAQVASHAPTAFATTPAQKPATSASTAAGKPVARVNGAVLTEADLVREEYAIFPYARQHNGGIPKDMAPQIRNGALKMIIFEELVYQEALRRKMTVLGRETATRRIGLPQTVFESRRIQCPDAGEFHGSEQLLQEKIKRSLLIEAFLKSEVDKSVVSLAEVRAYYDSNPARFQHPESFTFQTISVLPPARATAEQLKEGRERAQKEQQQAKSTKTAEEFGLLAEKVSEDDYRVMMGQHKPVPIDQLAPQVVKALLAMKVGEVSNVIQIEQAYTIVRLQQHTPAGKAKFDEVKPQLEKELQQNKSNKIRAALDSKLRQNATIEEL